MTILNLAPFQSSGTVEPVAVTSTSAWTSVGLFQIGGGKRGGLLTLTVGAGGALGDVLITRAALAGGTHVDWLNGTLLDSPLGEYLGSAPATGIHTLAAGAVGQLKFTDLDGDQEIQIWAKAASTPTTLQIDASFFP